MQLFDELRREHELIERLLGALCAYAPRFARADVDTADGASLIDILESYVGGWHHEREEAVLFPALVSADLPGDRGPIAVLRSDHEEGARTLAALRDASSEPSKFEQLAYDFARALWSHIDAENSVLFPESEEHLRRNHVRELPVREIPAQVRGIEQRAEALIAKYGSAELSDVVRGDGCAMCPAYGVTCEGVEREWWNEWQWEELDERIAST